MKQWSGRKAAARPNFPMRQGPSFGCVGGRRGRPGLLRRMWRLSVWLAIAVCLGWAAGWLQREVGPLMAGWLRVSEVTVVGATTLSNQEVVERLGLQPGETMVSVDLQKLTDRLKTHPWIKDATVSRKLPHTLVVSITERQPVAVLRTPAWALLLDADAHTVASLKESEDPGLPVLVGIDPKAFLLGTTQSREAALAGIRVARLVGHALHERPEVDMRVPDRAVAYVKGVRFQFGPSSVEEQWDRYRKIEPMLRTGKRRAQCVLDPLQEARQRLPPHASQKPESRCPEIDLRYPGKVIVRERG